MSEGIAEDRFHEGDKLQLQHSETSDLTCC
jgi:hypothetical protein